MVDTYAEDYVGQDIDGFNKIGAEGEIPAPITDIDQQVAEIYRTHGDVLIKIYKEI